jgi:delta 1-pyrroline-5-carboxylate dehydrogenase
MGAGTAVSIWSLIGGIFMIIGGGLLCLTIIGAIIGIPMIFGGMALIGGGAVAGGTIGAGKMAYRSYQEVKKDKREDIRFKAEMQDKGVCSNCGVKIKSKDSFCSKCGESLSEDNKEWECENCNESFRLGSKELKELRKRGEVKVKCPYCKKLTICEEN